MSWEKNQKQRDRVERQRQQLLSDLNYYTKHTFNEEDQPFVNSRIAQLQRDLKHHGIPGTYR